MDDKAIIQEALIWLIDHPWSTAYEVARACGHGSDADALHLYDLFCGIEKSGIITQRHRMKEVAMEWKVY